MNRFAFGLFGILLSTSIFADEWSLGEEAANHSLGLRSGYGEDWSRGIDFVLTLPKMSELSFDYSQSDFAIDGEEEHFDKYLIEFSTDPLATWSMQLDYSYSGRDGSLETKDVGFGVQYYPDNWLVKMRYLSGDAEIFARQEAIDAGLVANRSLQMDRDAIELTYQYFKQDWVWSVVGIDYDYSREINISPENLRARQVLGASSLTQLFGLLDWYLSMEVGYDAGRHFWRVGYADYALEVSGDTGKSPYLSWDYRLNETVSLGFLAAVGLDQSEHYSEASLRFHF